MCCPGGRKRNAAAGEEQAESKSGNAKVVGCPDISRQAGVELVAGVESREARTATRRPWRRKAFNTPNSEARRGEARQLESVERRSPDWFDGCLVVCAVCAPLSAPPVSLRTCSNYLDTECSAYIFENWMRHAYAYRFVHHLLARFSPREAQERTSATCRHSLLIRYATSLRITAHSAGCRRIRSSAADSIELRAISRAREGVTTEFRASPHQSESLDSLYGLTD